jgi:hypothetical protein
MNHSFDIATAKKYGVEEAVFIENMRFWIEKNKANERHFYEGRYWTYNSAKAFTQLFPYWTTSQVNRIIKKLETAGVLLPGNFNQSAYDRTKWYSLNEEIHFTESQNGNHGIEKTLIRTDINANINADTGASAAIEFPQGLNQQAWATWIDYRKKAGKALKPVSWPSAMQALVKHGASQMAVVEQSIANGWQGLFALKQGATAATHSDGTPLNKQEALEASNRAVVARFLAKEAQREAE